MKKYILPFIFIVMGIGCAVAYGIIGSEIAPDGTLVEPFFLIPMGYLFLFLGIITGLIVFIRSLYKKHKDSYRINSFHNNDTTS